MCYLSLQTVPCQTARHNHCRDGLMDAICFSGLGCAKAVPLGTVADFLPRFIQRCDDAEAADPPARFQTPSQHTIHAASNKSLASSINSLICKAVEQSNGNQWSELFRWHAAKDRIARGPFSASRLSFILKRYSSSAFSILIRSRLFGFRHPTKSCTSKTFSATHHVLSCAEAKDGQAPRHHKVRDALNTALVDLGRPTVKEESFGRNGAGKDTIPDLIFQGKSYEFWVDV